MSKEIKRFFNTAGPVRPDDHYCLSPLDRINREEILTLIFQKKYFILHAPRQTGKTSCLFALRDYLNSEGQYHCVYVNVEDAQAARDNVDSGIKAILATMEWQMRLNHENIMKKFPDWRVVLEKSGGLWAFAEVISQFCKNLKKPLVLLIDEIDSLVGDTLIALLRQLRSGYPERPRGFPSSVILCGLREVKDYRLHSSKEKAIITGGSCFNIKSESVRLGDFSQVDIRNLFSQHTLETGQMFAEEVFHYVWMLSEGQPWLVNALAYEACFKLEKDRTKPITKEIIENAKEAIILRRETHIDQLIFKLGEERVKRVIEPILASEDMPPHWLADDLSYCMDLGLIKKKEGKFVISNGIYSEVIPRELTYGTQGSFEQKTAWYLENGLLRMDKLLSAFQEFFRENSEIWLERFDYKEAGPHLLLMAFLQRIVNNEGRIHREYALGLKRVDLLVEFAAEKFALELKVFRNEKTRPEGINQIKSYIDKTGAKEGHLIIFNRTPNLNWSEKIFIEKLEPHLTLWGM